MFLQKYVDTTKIIDFSVEVLALNTIKNATNCIYILKYISLSSKPVLNNNLRLSGRLLYNLKFQLAFQLRHYFALQIIKVGLFVSMQQKYLFFF